VDIRGLAQQFITFASTETDKNGNRRSASTVSGYRRAMEGFVAAAESLNGGDLTGLPENFVESHWMATQQSVIEKPIQLRVRIGALKQFAQWCYRNNIPCAPLAYPQVKTPARKPKEEAVNDVTNLGDLMQADPVPTTTNVVPMQPYSTAAYAEPPPQQRAPAAPKAPAKPNGSGRPPNPLATLLPSGQYKLRVRREREMDDPVWVADYPAERVAVHGAIEPFLGREVAPRLAMQGLTGDVTFLVSAVGPTGTEGERARITVAVPAAPIANPTAPSMPMGVMTPPPQGADLAETLAYHRRAQEELEERLTKRIEQQKPAPMQEERRMQRNDEMDDLKRMVGSLASTVRDLADRLEDRDRDRLDGMQMMQQPQQPPAAPQLDLLAVIKEVASMTNRPQPAPPPPPQQPGMMEIFNMMAQAKQMFAPAQVNIDVSPLEERIEEMNKKLESQTKKKGEVSEVLSTMKDVRELMTLMGVTPGGAGKEKSGLGSALGSLVDKIVNDPEPIAMAVERVLNATAAIKAANSTGRAPPPPAPAQPRDPVPPQLRKSTEALIAANGDAATVAAAYEWITILGNIPQTKKLADRMTALLREEKVNELTVYLRQILSHFGYGDRIAIDAIQRIAATLVAQVKRTNAERTEEDDVEESDEEEDSGPDLTVRVGGTRVEEDYEEQDEDDESDDTEDDSDEEDSDEDSDEEDAEASDEDEVEEEPVVEAVEPEPQPEPKRSRRRKANGVMTQAEAADMTPDPLLNGVV